MTSGTNHFGESPYHAYMTTGNGGQILVLIPELELVAVFTGANYRQGGIWLRWPNEFLAAGIIPAIRTKTVSKVR
jgi:CubicO group peptidase (beta-lactamase class C family)